MASYNPHTIKSAQVLYVQWSHDINFDYSTGKSPSGYESDFDWEDTYKPNEHYIGSKLVGPTVFRREKIGDNGKWTVPIKLVGYFIPAEQEGSAVKSIWVSDDAIIYYELQDGTIVSAGKIATVNPETEEPIVIGERIVDANFTYSIVGDYILTLEGETSNITVNLDHTHIYSNIQGLAADQLLIGSDSYNAAALLVPSNSFVGRKAGENIISTLDAQETRNVIKGLGTKEVDETGLVDKQTVQYDLASDTFKVVDFPNSPTQFDATVGDAAISGEDGDYKSYGAAIIDGKYNLLKVGGTNEIGFDIGSNDVLINGINKSYISTFSGSITGTGKISIYNDSIITIGSISLLTGLSTDSKIKNCNITLNTTSTLVGTHIYIYDSDIIVGNNLGAGYLSAIRCDFSCTSSNLLFSYCEDVNFTGSFGNTSGSSLRIVSTEKVSENITGTATGRMYITGQVNNFQIVTATIYLSDTLYASNSTLANFEGGGVLITTNCIYGYYSRGTQIIDYGSTFTGGMFNCGAYSQFTKSKFTALPLNLSGFGSIFNSCMYSVSPTLNGSNLRLTDCNVGTNVGSTKTITINGNNNKIVNPTTEAVIVDNGSNNEYEDNLWSGGQGTTYLDNKQVLTPLIDTIDKSLYLEATTGIIKSKLTPNDLWTTVGNSAISGLTGAYTTIKAAIEAGYPNLQIIGGTDELSDITFDSSKTYNIVSSDNSNTINLKDITFLGGATNLFFNNISIILEKTSTKSTITTLTFICNNILFDNCVIYNNSTVADNTIINVNSNNVTITLENTKVYFNTNNAFQNPNTFEQSAASASVFIVNNCEFISLNVLTDLSYTAPKIRFNNLTLLGTFKRVYTQDWNGKGLYTDTITEFHLKGTNILKTVKSSITDLFFDVNNINVTFKDSEGLGNIRISAGFTAYITSYNCQFNGISNFNANLIGYFNKCIFTGVFIGKTLWGKTVLDNCDLSSTTTITLDCNNLIVSKSNFSSSIIINGDNCKFKNNYIITTKTITISGDYNDVSHNTVGTIALSGGKITDNGTKNTIIGNITENAIDGTPTSQNATNNITF